MNLYYNLALLCAVSKALRYGACVLVSCLELKSLFVNVRSVLGPLIDHKASERPDSSRLTTSSSLQLSVGKQFIFIANSDYYLNTKVLAGRSLQSKLMGKWHIVCCQWASSFSLSSDSTHSTVLQNVYEMHCGLYTVYFVCSIPGYLKLLCGVNAHCMQPGYSSQEEFFFIFISAY